MLHIKSSALTRGGVVGKRCDLEGNGRLLGDFTVRAALSLALRPRLIGPWIFRGEAHMHAPRDGLVWPVIGSSAAAALIESLLTSSNFEAFTVH